MMNLFVAGIKFETYYHKSALAALQVAFQWTICDTIPSNRQCAGRVLMDSTRHDSVESHYFAKSYDD